MTVVALDGPAGAGKSTIAKSVAVALGFEYLDTGAMYRALALAALEGGIGSDDEERLTALARSLVLRWDGARIVSNGKDVSARIREPDVTAAVSAVSVHPRVREVMVDRQRIAAQGRDVVVEGRDIGTTVFPNAEVKVFLTASLDERARRRRLQDGLPDDPDTIARIRVSIEARDGLDSARDSSPLARAGDAATIDTTGRSIEDVVEEIVSLVTSA